MVLVLLLLLLWLLGLLLLIACATKVKVYLIVIILLLFLLVVVCRLHVLVVLWWCGEQRCRAVGYWWRSLGLCWCCRCGWLGVILVAVR